MKLSLCIPTYNREKCLLNCLESLKTSGLTKDVQICISDNCSTDNTSVIIKNMMECLSIKYERNVENIGLARNILKVTQMAEGDFIWMIGDDDLLMPDAIANVLALLETYEDVDYFFVNSNHLTTEYVFSFPQPFTYKNLPEEMKPFSPRAVSGELMFLDLIHPNISFDYLGGIFLSVFRREKWVSSVNVIEQEKILNKDLFSNFDNTFPHVKIYAQAFANSKAFFCAKPLSVCLTGAREWSPMYCLIKSVRLVESIDQYRANGLPFLQYLRCKNAILNSFIPDMVYMSINKETSGFKYVNPLALALKNCCYPNVYLSPFYFILRKARQAMQKVFQLRVR